LCDLRQNYHTNAVLHTSEGPFLIDCGCTAPQSMKELGIPLWEVCGVFLTHMHADHAGGVEQLLWERYYTGPKGPSWLSTDIYGPNAIKNALRRSLMDNVDTVSGGQGVTYAGGYDLLVKWTNERAGGPGFAVGGHVCHVKRTHHVTGVDVDKPAYGLLVREAGASSGGFYWSGDCISNPDVGIEYPDVDVIFHDCMFAPKFPGTVHTHYSDLKALPADVKRKIILIHHTSVPKGVDVRADGFLWAGSRHESVSIFQDSIIVSSAAGQPLIAVPR